MRFTDLEKNERKEEEREGEKAKERPAAGERKRNRVLIDFKNQSCFTGQDSGY